MKGDEMGEPCSSMGELRIGVDNHEEIRSKAVGVDGRIL
jgi:hypothetical protein